MAHSITVPEDLPLFDVSTHDLYALAHGLIQSDVDHEFCHRLFKELVEWHSKVGRVGRRMDGGGAGVGTISVSPALLGAVTRQRISSKG